MALNGNEWQSLVILAEWQMRFVIKQSFGLRCH